LRELAFVREIVKRGDQFAVGEVTCSAKNNDRARFRRLPRAETFLEWIRSGCGLHIWLPEPNLPHERRATEADNFGKGHELHEGDAKSTKRDEGRGTAYQLHPRAQSCVLFGWGP
jgi:hypothetical protein